MSQYIRYGCEFRVIRDWATVNGLTDRESLRTPGIHLSPTLLRVIAKTRDS
jgi:hypothetical protein